MSVRFSHPLAFLLPLSIALTASCAQVDNTGRADAQVGEGSPEARAVVRMLNHESTTLSVLDDDARLNSRAATQLIVRRDGVDGTFGTADDLLFNSIAEVDAVKYVGPAALEQLVEYAVDNGWLDDDDDLFGEIEGVRFTVGERARALELVNGAKADAMREVVGLDTRAVDSIVAARPIDTLDQLAALYFVGPAMLSRIVRQVAVRDEVGLVSDLDKTVIPAHGDELPAAPFPGVVGLYNELEFGAGDAGDVYYVTARPPEMMGGIPEWLESRGVPAGRIDTGVSPIPHLARAEKFDDISAILALNPGQKFVFIGDTNHVDADAFRDIAAAYPDRVVAGFVHDVKTIDADRLVGLTLFTNYAEVAAELFHRGVFDEAAARAIIESARDEGLEMTDADVDALF